ncbi:MAG TPA: DUF3565 domain-containing protein [Bdellovibrionales bacterium]|nr:DUF3565 domain-containing protein [Bdellovibrionales bacterium]
MKQKIQGYHQDSENHWVAELECGHAQHVRHDPPWMERLWVTTKEGRDSRIDAELNCVRCDEAKQALKRQIIKECKQLMVEAYESAGISGLCEEGRWEAALSALDRFENT